MMRKKKRNSEIWKVITAFLSGIILGMLTNIEINIRESEKLDVNVEELNEEETNRAILLISDVKSQYLIGQKSITFTKEINEKFENMTGKKLRTGTLHGFNYDRNIIVQYENNLTELKKILCHELLHSRISGEFDEQIIRDIEPFEVCYLRETSSV